MLAGKAPSTTGKQFTHADHTVMEDCYQTSRCFDSAAVRSRNCYDYCGEPSVREQRFSNLSCRALRGEHTVSPETSKQCFTIKRPHLAKNSANKPSAQGAKPITFNTNRAQSLGKNKPAVLYHNQSHNLDQNSLEIYVIRSPTQSVPV